MKTYSNPRHAASFDDWPSGSHRVKCEFYVEHKPKKGYRVCRRTQDKHGRWCKPKQATYGQAVAILDGDDGRTYFAVLGEYGGIGVFTHDFMSEEYVHSGERFDDMLNLIRQAHEQAKNEQEPA